MAKLIDKIGAKRKDALKDIDADSDDLDLQARLYEILRYADDTDLRRNLSMWAQWLVSIWLFFVLVILVLNNFWISLSDTVLVSLLGTTTLNVLGLMYIVLKGYFQQGKGE